MRYIVFISHSLHWRYIKIALQGYVINKIKGPMVETAVDESHTFPGSPTFA